MRDAFISFIGKDHYQFSMALFLACDAGLVQAIAHNLKG